ncbi:Sec-independent protein translocase subunit TatA [Streptomyces sp. 6N223]|uniref:Sec-independent protein translocase subunit TatA n=1 Tax=Streptomyces sp. 6N223 TaxID=3457412 RepID=UPI003FCF0A15
MGQIGPKELVVLLIVVLLVFGAKRLPDIARSLGKSARILKSETRAMKAESASASQPQQPAANATANAGTGTGTTANAAEPAPKTIQAAPGDVANARPVAEEQPKSTSTQP